MMGYFSLRILYPDSWKSLQGCEPGKGNMCFCVQGPFLSFFNFRHVLQKGVFLHTLKEGGSIIPEAPELSSRSRAGQLQQLQDAGKVCRTLLCLSRLLHAVREIFLNLEWIPLLICKFYLVLLFFYSVLPKLFLNNLCVFTVNDTR